MGSTPSNASSIRLIVNLYQLSKAAGGTTARMNVQKLTKTLHSPCRQKMGGFPGNSEVRGNCVAGSNPAPEIWICGGIIRIASLSVMDWNRLSWRRTVAKIQVKNQAEREILGLVSHV